MASSTSAASADPGFLVLAPQTSGSYPIQPASKASSSTSTPSAETAVDLSAPVELIEPVVKERRSSSISSNGSAHRRYYLKLGPVYGGGDPAVPDFVEAEEK